MGLGVGLIATVLVPLALLLFGALLPAETLAAVLLLSGLWTLVFGLFLEGAGERFYYSGLGAVVAILSTFEFVPVRYTVGLVLVAIVVLAVLRSLGRPGTNPIKKQ